MKTEELLLYGAIGFGAYWLIKNILPTIGQGADSLGTGIGSGIGNAFQGTGSGIGTGIADVGQGAGTGIGGFFDNALSGIGQGISDLFNPVTTMPTQQKTNNTTYGYTIIQPNQGTNNLQFQQAAAQVMPTQQSGYYVGGSSTVSGGVGVSTMPITGQKQTASAQAVSVSVASKVASNSNIVIGSGSNKSSSPIRL